MKTMKKLVAAALALLIALSMAGAYGETVSEGNLIKFRSFFETAEMDALIPGLDEGFVPQGLCVVEEQNLLVISAYRKAGASALFFVDRATGEHEKTVYLKNADGSDYIGHAGGLAAGTHSLFITSGGLAQRVELEEALSAADQSAIAFADAFETGTRASLACVAGGVLWVGDFYTSGGNYETDKTHHQTTPAHELHHAWAVGYRLDGNQKNELRADMIAADGSVIPDYVLSLPDKIQGMTQLDDGRFVLSESYGRNATAYLKVYQNVLSAEPAEFVTLSGASVPLWYLDKDALIASCPAPCMTEALDAAGGTLYVLFESGAKTYSNGLCPLKHVYTLPNLPY